MPSTVADRNLLLGIIALQMDFVGRDALIAAMHAWVLNKDAPLSQVLQDQGALTAARRSLLDALVQEHLRLHDDDPQKSLAAISSIGSARDELSRVADSDIQASLARVSAARAEKDDPYNTVASSSLGTSTSAGTRFRILRPHAKGGLGQVSVALDQELDRQVALKEIQERHADDPESRARFAQEAEITGKLEHPGIIPVYGLGHDLTGRPFYAMRFIQGDSLKEAIARFHADESLKKDPAERSARLRELLRRFTDVCNAIAYAHNRGVLHRDLKPGNIMLGPYGETLVVDWGLAKPLGKSSEKPGEPAPATDPSAPASLPESPIRLSGQSGSRSDTIAGSAIGTPAFASPEQLLGRLDLLGPASDVYGLGATLYALLTGRAAVESHELDEVLRRVSKGDIPPPRSIDPRIPRPLEAICRKAMALKPEDRYDSARALAEDVKRWMDDTAVSAYPEPVTVRAARWARRHQRLVTGAAAAVLVGVIALAIAYSRESSINRDLREARTKAEDQEAKAILARDEAKKQRDTARLNAYIAHMNSTQREWDDNHIARVLDLLAGERPRDGETDLRDFEWFYFNRLCHPELMALKGHTGQVIGVAYSPDGRRIASASDDRTVKVWDTVSGQETLTLKGHTKGVVSVAYSPDGRRIASAGTDGTVKVWDAASGQETLTLTGHTEGVIGVAFSPGGRRIAFASGDHTVKVWDDGLGLETLTLKGHTDKVRGVAYSPDGRRIASASWDHTVKVWDADSGQEELTLKGQTRVVYGVAFSPDGRRIASAGGDGTVNLWDAASGQVARRLRGHNFFMAVYGVAYSPDGRRIASAGGDGTVRVWDADSGTVALTLYTGQVIGVAYSPDSRRIASASYDGTVKVWDASEQGALTLEGHTDQVLGVAFSPDGRRIASASFDGTVKVWDVNSGHETLTLKGHTDKVRGVAYSPDGRRIASASWDHTVKVWDAASGQETLTLKGHTEEVFGVAYSSDGRSIASAGTDGTVKVWDAASGQGTLTLKGRTSEVHNQVYGVAFSPDGRSIASADTDETVKVWDAGSRQMALTLKGHTSRVAAVAYSPDGRRIASASWDHTVKVWDAASGQEELTLKGHTSGVNGVAYSPDGRRIASAGDDHIVKVWDAASGQEMLTLKGHIASVMAVAYSLDGRRIASTDSNGTIKVWDGRDR